MFFSGDIVVCNNKKSKMMKKIILFLVVATFISCNSDDESNCIGAQSASTQALSAFTSDNSDANCLALEAALENQQAVCGSLSASLANTLAGLSCDN